MSSAVLHIPSSVDAYRAALEGLAALDTYIIANGGVPRLYGSGVRYKKEPLDTWRHALDVAGSGWGDCEDLAAYRVGELRASGEDPGAFVDTYATGPQRFHAVVHRTAGVIPHGARSRFGFPIEDPSLMLGMKPGSPTVQISDLNEVRNVRSAIRNRLSGGRRMTTARAVICGDPSPEYRQISFDLVKLPSGWSGVVRVPFSDGRALVMKTSDSASKANAARKSVNMATKAGSNPLVKAAMPPQAQAAVALLKSPAGAKAAKLLSRFGR